MKKILCFLVFSTFGLSFAYAQKSKNHLKISGGAEITTGIFKQGFNTGFGIYISDYYSVIEGGSILLSTGIASWKGNNHSGKAGLVLTRLGFRQFVGAGFYLQGDGGFGIGLENFSGRTRFSYGGGPGYLFASKNGSGFDISARVNRYGYRTWFGVAAGYQFKL
ncbi:hypothetical protein CAP36_05550 [Chitinophagaceae bacterium IBVUCB2]|nr:hypothetical protein CAP36_05550 [Chitinophagaceae bacterium IBVUCB2]